MSVQIYVLCVPGIEFQHLKAQHAMKQSLVGKVFDLFPSSWCHEVSDNVAIERAAKLSCSNIWLRDVIEIHAIAAPENASFCFERSANVHRQSFVG
jgi:hypothetical protein